MVKLTEVRAVFSSKAVLCPFKLTLVGGKQAKAGRQRRAALAPQGLLV